jgi:hypothetical protein
LYASAIGVSYDASVVERGMNGDSFDELLAAHFWLRLDALES